MMESVKSALLVPQVLDAGGTQTNNPRYARFAFHAAGMKDTAQLLKARGVFSSPKASEPAG